MAGATPCATLPGDTSTVYTATDSPVTVTTTGGSTDLSITFTADTNFNYLRPDFALDVRNGNDGVKPSYTPPSYQYSVNGGGWSSVATTFDTSGIVGGDTWAAYLPEWTNVSSGSVVRLKVRVTFGGNMPSGTYASWFGILDNEVCNAENLSLRGTSLSDLTYSPTATRATPTAQPTTAKPTPAAPAGSASNAVSSASAARSTGASSNASPVASATATATATGTEVAAVAPLPTPSVTVLGDVQRAASSSSGSSAWLAVLGVLTLLGAAGGGAFALRRRAARTES